MGCVKWTHLDGLQGVAALGHVTLDLPRELHLVGDVQVDLEVQQVAHALVVERVQALDDLRKCRHTHRWGSIPVRIYVVLRSSSNMDPAHVLKGSGDLERRGRKPSFAVLLNKAGGFHV
jgi:hypothetical protein